VPNPRIFLGQLGFAKRPPIQDKAWRSRGTLSGHLAFLPPRFVDGGIAIVAPIKPHLTHAKVTTVSCVMIEWLSAPITRVTPAQSLHFGPTSVFPTISTTNMLH
jgi:hypothetical protein